MTRYDKPRFRAFFAAALLLVGAGVAGAPAALRAVCVGDCNSDNKVVISEVQRCVNISLNPQTIDSCRNADQDGDGTVSAAEVDACIASFLDAANCPTVLPTPTPQNTSTPTTTSTATATSTVPPTNTPTDTPAVTNTPTATYTATNTVPPTTTPTLTPTDTPVPPSATPSFTVTATVTATATPSDTVPPSATSTPTITPSVQANVCGNGIIETYPNGFQEDCDNGGICVGGPTFCQTGPNALNHDTPCTTANAATTCGVDPNLYVYACYGNPCTSSAQCGAGTCVAFGGNGCAANCTSETVRHFQSTGATCSGGPNAGTSCTDVGDTGTTSTTTVQCGFNGSCLGVGECVGGSHAGSICANGPLVCLGGSVKGRQCGGSGFSSGKNDCRVCVGGTRTGLPCDGSTSGSLACTGGGTCPTLVCNGGAHNGAACTPATATTTCGSSTICNTILICNGGTNDGQACVSDASCGTGGVCGPVCGNQCGAGGTCANKSRALLTSPSLKLDIGPLIVRQDLTTGRENPDGTIPVAVKAASVRYEPVKVPGLACACVGGGEDASVHGPGNGASGLIGCGPLGLTDTDVTESIDHNTTPGPQCIQGVNLGSSCASDNDCTGQGTCPDLKCVGGDTPGEPCSVDDDCFGGGLCRSICATGPFVGQTCGGDFDCTAFGKCNKQGPGTCSANSLNAGALCAYNTDCQGAGTACEGAFQGGGLCVGGPNVRKRCTKQEDCPDSICNSPDDPTCIAADPLPERGGRKACLEAKQTCNATGTEPAGTPCTKDVDCGTGGACGTPCNATSLHPAVCNSPVHITVHGGQRQKGSAVIVSTIAIGTIIDNGTCASGDGKPEKGADGIPCTADDLPSTRGNAQTIPTTTGTAQAIVVDINAFEGTVLMNGQCSGANSKACASAITGSKFDCDALKNNPTGGLSGVRLAAAFPEIESANISDNTVINLLTAK